MRVLISGATGTVGRVLVRQLADRHDLLLVSRDVNQAKADFSKLLSPTQQQRVAFAHLGSKLAPVDAVVHLAGTKLNFSRRWDDAAERVIRESRTATARTIVGSLSAPPKTWIQAAAVGWYGLRTDPAALHVETEAPANDFTGRICQAVEAEAAEIGKLGVRTVCLRLGVVLANDAGGTLEQMATPVRLFVGAPVGSGQQAVAWVHVEDAAAAFAHALERESMRGAFNLVAPVHVTNAEFTRAIARVLGRPLLVPFNVPAVVLQTALGDFAALALEGSRVSSQKLQSEAGFTFRFGTVDAALRNLLLAS